MVPCVLTSGFRNGLGHSTSFPPSPLRRERLAKWEFVTGYSSATVPESHRVPGSHPPNQYRKELPPVVSEPPAPRQALSVTTRGSLCSRHPQTPRSYEVRTVAELEVDGRKLQVSNLQKILYPKAGFTKGDVINYYIRIAPYLLPHVKNRALTLKRYPNGVEGMFFYEKNCPAHRPPWVKTAPIWSEGNNRIMDYCLANDLPTLVWAANLADLEIHTSLACSKYPERPTMLVFDLDPGAPADIVKCCKVGLWLRDILKSDGLECYAKTSGSKGLQVYAPLNTAATFDGTKIYAKNLAERLEKEHPEDVVSKMLKKLRMNKILVDWSQNDPHKTTVCVYSLRAKDHPTVSTPITWDEAAECLERKDPDFLVFNTEAAVERAKKNGDLFEPVLTQKQKLPKR